MKVFSPLFAVALAVAAVAPGVPVVTGDTCVTNCAGTCQDAKIAGGATKVITTDGTCPARFNYLTSLKVSETGGNPITVTFSGDVTDTATKSDKATTATTSTCYLEYADVGKKASLTKNLEATVTCTDSTVECDIKYAAVYACQPDPLVCDKTCDAAGCTTKTIQKDGQVELATATTCPAYSYAYLKSLVVGTNLAAGKVAVKVGTDVQQPTTADSVSQCYSTFGQITTPKADVKAIVTCPEATASCVVKVNPVWDCTAPICPTLCTGTCTEESVVAGAVIEVKPATGTCQTGSFAYLQSLTVNGKDGKDIEVSFSAGATPSASTKDGSCFYSYTDVIGTTSAAADVKATLKCKSATEACKFQHKETWGCYTPPDATKTYTRTEATGDGCKKDASDCANRCAKSYQLGTKGTDMMFVPQFTGDCKCPPLTATTSSSDPKAAANSGTGMNVAFTTKDSVDTMTIEYTKAGELCKSTYTKTAFTSSFEAKTYTRGSVTPPTCETDEIKAGCDYKCGAEFVLTKPETDTVVATSATVQECVCPPIKAIVADGGSKASGGNATVTYAIETGSTGVTLVTTIVDTTPKICTALYTEKPAPVEPTPTEATKKPDTTTAPPPTEPTTTAKTATSTGVSAADAGLVTVTLVAAAAGVQAIGLPA